MIVSPEFKWSVEAALIAADMLELENTTKAIFVKELCRRWEEAERNRKGKILFEQIKYGRNPPDEKRFQD